MGSELRERFFVIGWIVVGGVTLGIIMLSLLPPFFYRLGLWGLYNLSYDWLPICHQLPSRSFWIWGTPLGLCARCFGIYLGVFAAIVLTHRQGVSRLWAGIGGIAVVIMLIEVGLTWQEVITGTNALRWALGSSAGIGSVLILRACTGVRSAKGGPSHAIA